MKLLPVEEYAFSIFPEAYLVGGAVRNHIMEVPPKDYDFACHLSVEEMEERIKGAGRHVYKIGAKFGTLGFKYEGELIEITTFRQETYTKNSRKPQVEYVTNLLSDLNRRDFTINAMALSRKGKLIDPWNGQEDIKKRLIRAVDRAKTRFKEDPLRIMRAARFASTLGFDLDPKLVEDGIQVAHRLLIVSPERWGIEFDKILESKIPSIGLEWLGKLDALRFILPELHIQIGYNQSNPHHSFTLFEHTLAVCDNAAGQGADFLWACLLHDIGKPYAKSEKDGVAHYYKHDMIGAELVRGISSRLKWSNARTKLVIDLVEHHMDKDSPLSPYDKYAKGVLDD